LSVPPEGTGLLFEEEAVPPLRRHGTIHVGTSGFSFDDWRGVFYPGRLERGRWLTFYARHFTAVEINATYYRTPAPAAFQAMVDRTPEGFGFWVKVPGQATHTADDFSAAMSRFLEAVKPLNDAGRLRGFLAQFPPSFRRSVRAFDRVSRLHDALKDRMLAVEFRHNGWLVDETFAFMKDRGLVYVVVDLPPLPGLPGPELHITGPASYVRFHGLNSRAWNNPSLGDRYDYEYSLSQLKEWLPRIAELDGESSTSYLFFNNCHAGQAVKNARMLRQLLEMESDQ